jgi:hypothetical protein
MAQATFSWRTLLFSRRMLLSAPFLKVAQVAFSIVTQVTFYHSILFFISNHLSDQHSR